MPVSQLSVRSCSPSDAPTLIKTTGSGATTPKVIRFTDVQKSFVYIWEFLKNEEKWVNVGPRDRDPNAYFVEGKFVSQWREHNRGYPQKNKKTIEAYGKLRKNYFIERKDGVAMVLESAELRTEYMKYCIVHEL